MMDKEYLNSLFTYKDGKVFWKVARAPRVKIGDEAGCMHHKGYRQISIDGKKQWTHRVVWIMHKGVISEDLMIDHIDGNKTNNKLENLRLVTNQENQFNRHRAKGYYFSSKDNKYRARIEINGKKKSLGYYDTEEEARSAYLKAKEELHIIENRKD